MNLTSILFVGLGAATGGILRFFISEWLPVSLGRFPMATFIVNLAGSFILGVILGLNLKQGMSLNTKLLLTTGFCGGFTTFSTFSMETIQLIQNGNVLIACFYILGSVLGGLLCAWGGYRLGV